MCLSARLLYHQPKSLLGCEFILLFLGGLSTCLKDTFFYPLMYLLFLCYLAVLKN